MRQKVYLWYVTITEGKHGIQMGHFCGTATDIDVLIVKDLQRLMPKATVGRGKYTDEKARQWLTDSLKSLERK